MEKNLRATPFAASHILLTGATGYMGALIVASLLRDTAGQITCLTRSMHDRAALLAPIIEEWEAQAHGCWSDAVESRVHQMKLPENMADVAGLAPQLERIDEIVHCAGCLDYYDIPKLQAVNVGYTAHLIVLARRLALKRFVYISTAYSSGYQPHVTAEALLPEPKSDPTQYTRTKREAERLACDRYHPHFHTVAPELPLNLLHQDAFCHAFKLAYHWLPNDAFMNLVSNPQTSPSMRDLWDMWFEVTRPRTIYYYASFDHVPFKEIPPRQRAYLTFAQVNLEIASHHWQFEATWLELLRGKGLDFVDASTRTVRVCQDRFVASSDLIGKYLNKHAAELAQQPQIVAVAAEQAETERELAIA
ncbi:MAG: SDR family oxidoreductase [Betaproteobacteria bacterium]